MNYYFVFAGIGGRYKDVPFQYIQNIDPPLRPVLGQIVEIKGKQYKINRCDPIDNSATEAVTYYLELYNTNYPYKLKKKYASHGGYGSPEFKDI